MGTTTNFSLRYPAAGASNNVPSDIQNLATDTDTALNGRQAADADLTTIAGLDSTSSGVIASDGSGWARKAYSALKTSLSLVKGDVGLGSVDNTADTAKPVSTAQQTALDLKVSYVNHGSTAGTTRPATASEVLWVGSATPSNGATNDMWWDTTNVLLKRYTGSVWAASGSTAYAPLTAAWNAWTPTITGSGSNPTYTNNDSRYLLNGKTLKLQLNVAFTSSGSGTFSLTLPASATSARSPEGLTAVASSTATSVIGWSTTAGSTSIGFIGLSNNTAFGTGLTFAGNSLWLNADIEVT